MRHHPLWLLLLGLPLLLMGTGCWDRREVNEVAITTSIAIDLDPDRSIRATAQILQPAPTSSQGDQGAAPRSGTFSITATGKTMMDALRNLNEVVSRRPEWTHNNAIILGEEIARQGVGDLLDFFVRDHESRLDQWILVARGRAEDVIVPRFRLEANQGLGFRRTNRNAFQSTGKAAQARLNDFLIDLASPPAAPIAAVVDLTSPEQDPNAPPEAPQRVRIHGAAVFRGDRLAGWLDAREVRGLQWFRGRMAGSAVVVPCLDGNGRGIGVEVLSARSTMRPVWQKGKFPSVRVAVRVAAKLGDLMCAEDLSKPAALRQLASRSQTVIADEMTRVMDRLQHELKADPAGVNAAVARAYPGAYQQWKPRWSEVFPQIQIVPEVQVQLVQIGTMTGRPLVPGSGGK